MQALVILQEVEAEDAAGIVYEDVSIAQENDEGGWGGGNRLFIDQKALQVGTCIWRRNELSSAL